MRRKPGRPKESKDKNPRKRKKKQKTTGGVASARSFLAYLLLIGAFVKGGNPEKPKALSLLASPKLTSSEQDTGMNVAAVRGGAPLHINSPWSRCSS